MTSRFDHEISCMDIYLPETEGSDLDLLRKDFEKMELQKKKRETKLEWFQGLRQIQILSEFEFPSIYSKEIKDKKEESGISKKLTILEKEKKKSEQKTVQKKESVGAGPKKNRQKFLREVYEMDQEVEVEEIENEPEIENDLELENETELENDTEFESGTESEVESD